jgi:hypothetical protein
VIGWDYRREVWHDINAKQTRHMNCAYLPTTTAVVIALVQGRMRWFLGSARGGHWRRVPTRQTYGARQETPVGMHMYGGIPGQLPAALPSNDRSSPRSPRPVAFVKAPANYAVIRFIREEKGGLKGEGPSQSRYSTPTPRSPPGCLWRGPAPIQVPTACARWCWWYSPLATGPANN